MIADFSLSALAKQLNARTLGLSLSGRCEGVSTDTRTIKPGDLFVALKGPRFDAHDYVGGAIGKGAVAAVVDHEIDPELPQLVVADTLTALGELGAYNRSAFDGPLFAVTGSSGKTSVKEMLAAMLATQGETLATRGNLNNEIGVPLTLLRLAPEHRYAVVELGASALGEIARTTRMARPQVAILNNVLGAHLEGFGSLANIVKAKGEIFEGLPAAGVGIVNRDDPHAPVWLDQLAALQRRALTFGVDNADADVEATALQLGEEGCYRFCLRYREQRVAVQLAVMGRHMVANAAAAAAAWIAAGFELTAAVAGLEAFRAVPGRLSPQRLAQGALLVDDSYNANPGSMRAAIDVLTTLPAPRTLIIGDMGELGPAAAQLHAEIGRYAAQAGIDRLLCCGALMRHACDAASAAGLAGRHFASFDALRDALRDEPVLIDLSAGALLVKGSRSAGMDRVVTILVDGKTD